MGELWEWQLTAWRANGSGGWKQQPIITIEGKTPFFADHPLDYINKLQEMHDDPAVMRGIFYTMIGQLKDLLDNSWEVNDGRSSDQEEGCSSSERTGS